MKKESKIIKKVMFVTMALSFLVLFHMPVMAVERTLVQTDVVVDGYSGDTSQLRIRCEENIYDTDGKKLTDPESDLNCSFSNTDGKVQTQAEIYPGVRYAVSDGIDSVKFVLDRNKVQDGNAADVIINWNGSAAVDVSAAPTTSEENEQNESGANSADNSTNETGGVDALTVATKGPAAAAVGDVVKYTVTEIKSESDSDTFLLQCDIPKGTELVSVYTGSFNSDIALELLCKTENDGMWHSWGQNISSAKGSTFNTEDITFADGDRISSIALSAESAPKDFVLDKQDPFYYQLKIVSEEGTKVDGSKVKVTAYVDNSKQSSESGFSLTTVQNTIQTGDDNYLLVGSVILIFVCVVVLIGYITVRIVTSNNEKSYQKHGKRVKYKKDKSAGVGQKLTFLKDKDPG